MKSRKIHWSVAMAWAFLNTIFNNISALQAAEVPVGIKLAERQQLVFNNSTEVVTLDPYGACAVNVPELNVLVNLLEGLCTVNSQEESVPGVAERWEESSDGKTWTFYLRPTARWSNGDPVTAHDFVYSWRRLADPKTASPRASILASINLLNSFAITAGHQPTTALGVTALDDHTLELQLSHRHPFLIKILSGGMLFPLHRATVEKHGSKWTLPANYVGNGAYCLQAWTVNDKIVLRRNPHYWDNANTRIDQATFLPLASKNAELMQYRAGEIDIGSVITPDGNFGNLQQELPQQVRRFPLLSVTSIAMNNRNVPFNDVQVRRALALALDRQAISKCPFAQEQRLAYGIIPDGAQGVKAIRPVWAAWSQEKRIQEAQKLLKASGYSAQRPLHFSLQYTSRSSTPDLVLVLAGQWEKNLPVKVTLDSVEWCTYIDNINSGRYQVAVFHWLPSYYEPYALLESLRSSCVNNSVSYRSQQFDDCLDQVMWATNEPDRRRRYQQAERQLEQDMPLIPLIHRTMFRLVKTTVGGLGEHTVRMHIKNLYIMKQ